MPVDSFVLLCVAHGLPRPEKEFRFHPTRRWRFDYAFPDRRIAVEQEGGAFVAGRHSRGAGFLKDMEKYNEAAMFGWRVLRYTPKQIASGQAVQDLRVIFKVVDALTQVG